MAKYIWVSVIWIVILLVKIPRFSEFSGKLKSATSPKWKTWAELFYKSPYFFVIVILSVYEFLFDRVTPKDKLLLFSGLVYLVPILIFIIFRHFFNGKHDDLGTKHHIRGSSVSEETALTKALLKCTDDRCLPITAKIKIPIHYETTHFFSIGRPGCGKSQLFYRVIQKVIERKDKAIIYDFKGDQVAKFFNPDKDLLFNPFDKRCVNWNIFNEIETQLDIRSIANSLIPITGNDPYWSNAARDVFAGILLACFLAGKKTNEEIYQCCNMPAHDLSDFLSKYKGTETATKHLTQDKAGQSILSVMGSSTQCFEYLRNLDGDFSIKKWVSDPEDRRTVFLTNYSEISDTIRPILSLLIELAGKRVLSIPDDRQRRFFFFIDEFGTLNNLPTIPTMLTNGRSKGMSVWIALQDMGQIDKIYGKEISQTIINSCATTFTFAANDPYTADYLSKKIGDREIRQTNVSESSSAQGASQTTSQQTLNERVVLPSQIMNLPNLVMLLKLPEYDTTPVWLDIVSIPDSQASYVPRDDISLKTEPAEPEATGRPPEVKRRSC